MFDPAILFAAVLNGATTGAVYALVALGLTLIYGVLHIINFAHGAALMIALYAVWWLHARLGIDPYLALPIVVAGMFAFGYALQRGVIERASHGKDENILLATLGIAIVLENLALIGFKSDTRTIDTAYTLTTIPIGPAMIALPKLIAFGGALAASALLIAIVTRTDLGRAIRAVAKEKQGARLVGIDVAHVYAMSFGIGLACVGAAACFLLPAYYVNPQVGAGFVLVAFTIVVLGGMGSFAGALLGGLLIGIVESLCGLYLGESLGQIGIFVIFIAVLLLRPQGLFGGARVRDVFGIAALVIVCGAIAAFVNSGVVLTFVTMTLYAALLAQAWNIVGGFGGQFSFGHALFFGTGAYVQAIAQLQGGLNAWVALGLAIGAAGAIGAVTGAIAFRYGLKGSYFALVTLAFAEVARIVSLSVGFTGGGVGLMVPLSESVANMQFGSRRGYLLLALALLVIALIVTSVLRRSRFGAWLQAVRDNEDAARAVGVNPFSVKLAALTLSGALMGAAGAFYVQMFQYIDPGIAFGPATSVEALVAAIVGGMGTLWGPLLGAAVLHLLAETTRNLFGAVPGINMVIYGAVLVLIVTFAPRGIVGLFRR